MFGRDRETASATVVATDLRGRHAESLHRWAFVLDVHPTDGEPFRAEATEDIVELAPHPEPGDTVTVSYRAKGLDHVRLELKGDPRFDAGVADAQSRDQFEAALAAPAGTASALDPKQRQWAAQEASMAYAVLRKGLESTGRPGVADVVTTRIVDDGFPPLVGLDVDATVRPDDGAPPYAATFRAWVDPASRPVPPGAQVFVRIAAGDPTVIALDHSRS